MPRLQSWVPVPKSSHFSLANLPFGIVSTASSSTPRPAVAIGEHCLDLQDFAVQDGFSHCEVDLTVFSQPTLNAFAALGQSVHRRVREYLQDVLSESTSHPAILKDNAGLQSSCLLRQDEITIHLPMQIGDYTDFSAGKNHAFNAGAIFQGPGKELHPNYLHLPIAYHGRASSVVVSGTPITRPNGQIVENPTTEHNTPIFSPCKRLDIELELGAFLCKDNTMGSPVPISEAGESIFGMVLLNDWSARDVQFWESVPLGPFNAKNFGTTISPWVVLTDALDPFRMPGIANETTLLPYLQEKEKKNVYDISLSVDLAPQGSAPTTILRSNAKHLIYSFAQMLAHHTIGGCPMRVGDLLGSGTLSGTEAGSQGALLEVTKNGKEKIKLEGGQERTYLEDGDTVTLRGVCGDEETGLVGFGECVGMILPSPKI